MAGDAGFSDPLFDTSSEPSLSPALAFTVGRFPVVVTGWADNPNGSAEPLDGYTSNNMPTLFGTAKPDAVITFTGIAYASPVEPVITGQDGKWHATIGPLPGQKRDFAILAVAKNHDENGRQLIRYLSFPATNDSALVTQNTTQTQQLVLPDDLPLGVYRYAIRLQDTKIGWEDYTDENTDGRGFHRGPVQTFTFAVVPPYQSLQRNEVKGDVSGDGSVSAGDALIIINHLSTQSIGESESITAIPNGREFRMDVNRDGIVSAVDALQVINQMAITSRTTTAKGETAGATDDSDDQWQLSVDQWLTALETENALF